MASQRDVPADALEAGRNIAWGLARVISCPDDPYTLSGEHQDSVEKLALGIAEALAILRGEGKP